ncbi:MAG: hypothetical protein ABH881_03415 [bacterium]
MFICLLGIVFAVGSFGCVVETEETTINKGFDGSIGDGDGQGTAGSGIEYNDNDAGREDASETAEEFNAEEWKDPSVFFQRTLLTEADCELFLGKGTLYKCKSRDICGCICDDAECEKDCIARGFIGGKCSGHCGCR